MTPRALVNRAYDPAAVPAPSHDAAAFHASLDGYAPTPLRDLPALAAELGLGAVALKDESRRLGLPAFKVLGASWAVERALRDRPDVHTLVAASAGNHGRAVAHVAALRGLAARIHVPVRSAAARREAIAAEGAEVVVAGAATADVSGDHEDADRRVAGDYEDAVRAAEAEGARDGWLLLADVGDSPTAHWVIDGYATLFAEAAEQGDHDLIVVPSGVGSLAAAAARHGAAAGATVLAVEPVTAACLTASLAVGEPTSVPAPGTSMAGLDAAEVSAGAWPDLLAGVLGTVTVADREAHAAMRELAAAGLEIGDCGAATLAALRALATDAGCRELRDAARLGPGSRVLLVATEGATDPAAYRAVIG